MLLILITFYIRNPGGHEITVDDLNNSPPPRFKGPGRQGPDIAPEGDEAEPRITGSCLLLARSGAG